MFFSFYFSNFIKKEPKNTSLSSYYQEYYFYLDTGINFNLNLKILFAMNTMMCYFLVERRVLIDVDKLWVFRLCENVSHLPTHKHAQSGQ